MPRGVNVAVGQTRSSGDVRIESAFHPIATKSRTSRQFGFGPLAGSRTAPWSARSSVRIPISRQVQRASKWSTDLTDHDCIARDCNKKGGRDYHEEYPHLNLQRLSKVSRSASHYAACSTRMLISPRSVMKSIGLVRSASAPPSSALRLVSASP